MALLLTHARLLSGRVISGQPVARPPVISLCCGVARRVIDQFGTGVSESQAGGLAEALVARLALGISGKEGKSERCCTYQVLQQGYCCVGRDEIPARRRVAWGCSLVAALLK